MEHRIHAPAQIVKKPKKLSFSLGQHQVLFGLTFCLLAGVLAGALYYKYHAASGFYTQAFTQYRQSVSGGFFTVLLDSVLKILPYAAGVFLSGTCMAGMLLAPVITAVCGYNFGVLSGHLYAAYKLNGIMFHLLLVCPWATVLSSGRLLSAREAVGFSVSIARLAFPGRHTAMLDRDFKLYCTRQLFVLLYFSAAALLRTVLSCCFGSFFSF